ncbi:hypothetical protein [Clostridium thermobutyricum]|uniref:hypothetical protein n=1 Tax=Clostridium thermobutyricum TaxID=29372 RepID=UPI0018A8F4DE|nr:hypothetical protein [Clostridium thermobutyricum]
MAEGWIKIHRNIQEHWLWNSEPFSKGQAWIDLLLMVNHQDNKIMLGGDLIEVKRGQRVTSLRQLADRWKWSRTKVSKFLEVLSKDNMIEYKSDTKKTVLTIVNYELYQDKENTKKPQKSHRNDSEVTPKSHRNDSEVTQKDTNKNEKKEKNDNNEKNEEEGEEKTSHSTLDGQDRNSIENKIFDIVGEIPFESWFKKCDIYETDKNIVIKADNELIERTIKKYYLEKLNALLNKNILLEKREEDKMG